MAIPEQRVDVKFPIELDYHAFNIACDELAQKIRNQVDALRKLPASVPTNPGDISPVGKLQRMADKIKSMRTNTLQYLKNVCDLKYNTDALSAKLVVKDAQELTLVYNSLFAIVSFATQQIDKNFVAAMGEVKNISQALNDMISPDYLKIVLQERKRVGDETKSNPQKLPLTYEQLYLYAIKFIKKNIPNIGDDLVKSIVDFSMINNKFLQRAEKGDYYIASGENIVMGKSEFTSCLKNFGRDLFVELVNMVPTKNKSDVEELIKSLMSNVKQEAFPEPYSSIMPVTEFLGEEARSAGAKLTGVHY